ncbi:dihydrofolate reductase, partial [Acinetobacter baumannii]|uniref:dihydrofolate reductase n=1 Tax=Acinetobacter baumannii TaxID=470 RepID=UPI001D193917
ALPWLVGENLEKLGVKILNTGITGQCHRDRKLLTNRVNWVITRDINWHFDGVKIAYSIEDALNAALEDAKKTEKQALFIIGGCEIFKQTLSIAYRL